MEVGPLPPFIIVDGYRFTRVEDFKTRNLNWLCAASTRCTATVRTDKTGTKVLRKIGVHRRCRRVPEEEQQLAVEDEARRFLPGIEYRPIIAEVKGFITCILCNGYLIDATTITGCLHTFCRSCIIKHLEEKRFCPKCNTYLPHENGDYTDKAILPDNTVQTLVYKLVPGLYKSETERRLKAIKDLKTHVDPVNLPLVSPDDTIHISIEYCRSTADGVDVVKDEATESVLGKRYLKCPSGVTIRILKRFIRMKYGIQEDWRVEIFYNGESMHDNFSLADMIYTFGSEKDVPIAFSYQVYLEKSLPLHSPNKHHVIQKENTRTETSAFTGKNEVASSVQQFSKSSSKSAELSALLVGTPKVRLVTKRRGKRKKRHGAATVKRLKLLASKLNTIGEKSDVLHSTGPPDDDHTVLSVFSTETGKGFNGMLATKPLLSDLKQSKNAPLENINQLTPMNDVGKTNTERSLRCRSKTTSRELIRLSDTNMGLPEKPRRCKKKYESSHSQDNKSLETVAICTNADSNVKSSKISPSDAASLKVRNNSKRRARECIKPYNTFIFTGRKLVNKHWLSGTLAKFRYRYLMYKTAQHAARIAKKNMRKERCEVNKTLAENIRLKRQAIRDLKTEIRRKAYEKSEILRSNSGVMKNNSGSKIPFSADKQAKESDVSSNGNADDANIDIHMDLESKETTSENCNKSADDSLQVAGRQFSEKCNNLNRIIDVVKSNTSPKAKDISAKSEIVTGRRQNELYSDRSMSGSETRTESKSGLSENISLPKPGLEFNMSNKYNFFNNKLNSPAAADNLMLGSDIKSTSAVNANGGQDDANNLAKNMAFEFSEEEEDDEVELVLRISESEDEQSQAEINAEYETLNNKNIRSSQPNRKTKPESSGEADNCKKSKLNDEPLQFKNENINKIEEKLSINSEYMTQVENGLKTLNSVNKSSHKNNIFVPVTGGRKSVCEIKLPMKESNKLTPSNVLGNNNRNASSQNQRMNEMKKSYIDKDSRQIKAQNNLCSFGFNGSNSTITPKYKTNSSSGIESARSEENIVNAAMKCEVKSDISKELSKISCKASGIDVKKPKCSDGKLSTKTVLSKELLLPFTLSVAKNDIKQASDNVDVSLKPSLEILRLNPLETDSSNKGYPPHASPAEYAKGIPKKPTRKPPPPIPIVRISKVDEHTSEISQLPIKKEVKEAQSKSSEMKAHFENSSGFDDTADKRIKSEVLDLSKKSARITPVNSSLIYPNHVNMIKNPHVSSEHKFSYPRSASTLSPPINVRSSPPTPKTSPTLSDGSFDSGYAIHANDSSSIVSEMSPVRNSNISKALDNARSSALINTLSSATASKDYHLHSAIAVLNRERMCGASVNVRPCDFPPSQRMTPNKANNKMYKSLSEKNPKLERSKSTGSLHMNHPQACPDSFPKFYPDPRSPILSPTQTAFRESPILARHITGKIGKTEQPKDSKGGFQRNGKTKVDGSDYFATDSNVPKASMLLGVGRLAPQIKAPSPNPYPCSATPKGSRKYLNAFAPNSVDSYEKLEESPRCSPTKKLKFHDKSPPGESFPQSKLPYAGYSAMTSSRRSELMKSQTPPSILPTKRLQLENSLPRQEMDVKKLNHVSNYNHMKTLMNKQQNQTIRHIPNPSALTFRQQRSNVNADGNSGNAVEQNTQKKKPNVEAEMCEVDDQDNRNVNHNEGNKIRSNSVYAITKSPESKNIVIPETPNSVNYALGNNDIKYGTVNSSISEGFQTARNRNNYGRSKTPTPELSYGERIKHLYNRRSKTPTPDLSTLEKNNNDANKNLNPFVLLPVISDVRSLAAGDFNNSDKGFRNKRRNSAVMEN